MDYFNPVAVVDAAGDVKERYTWTAFGIRSVMAPDWVKRESSSYEWDFGFNGQFLDTETGWYDYGYRYYSPEIGRWLSRDPIGERGGTHLYKFIFNNPLNGLDLLGLASDNKKEIRIGFLGLNPRQFLPGGQTGTDPGWVDGAAILNASADKVFESLGWEATLNYVTAKIDQDKSGGLSSSECKSHTVMVAAYSWGAWSALIFAEELYKKRESETSVEVRLGLVDPVRFKRIGGSATRPNGVSHLVNYYQRYGLGFDVMGVKGERFVGESISGADIDQDVSNEVYTDPYSGSQKQMDHIGIWYTYGQSIVDIAFNPPE